jgi:class 3 adenylate cyclase
MNHAILGQNGTVMQFIGDAVMAVFGAPRPMHDHAARAVAAAHAMHTAQETLNQVWVEEGRTPFRLGIAVSTGVVAAALLGSEERLEYSVVGDTVNLSQRMQEWAQPGETVLSEATYLALDDPPLSDLLEPARVKGRTAPVTAYRLPRRT